MWNLGSGVRFMRLLDFSIYIVGPILGVSCMAIQYFQLKEEYERPWVFTLIVLVLTLIPYIWYHFLDSYWVMILATLKNYMLCGLVGCFGGYLIYFFNKLFKKKKY